MEVNIMTNIKKEYRALIVVDDYLENAEIIPGHSFVRQLVDDNIKEYEDGIVKGYELNDTVHWKIVRWKEKLILLPTI